MYVWGVALGFMNYGQQNTARRGGRDSINTTTNMFVVTVVIIAAIGIVVARPFLFFNHDYYFYLPLL